MDTMGGYIKARRKAIHITQEELSNRLKSRGVDRDPAIISKWERNKSPVPLDIIPTLAAALEESSPNRLYDLAGVIQNLKGADVVRLLEQATSQDIEYILDLIRVHLKHGNQNR